MLSTLHGRREVRNQGEGTASQGVRLYRIKITELFMEDLLFNQFLLVRCYYPHFTDELRLLVGPDAIQGHPVGPGVIQGHVVGPGALQGHTMGPGIIQTPVSFFK